MTKPRRSAALDLCPGGCAAAAAAPGADACGCPAGFGWSASAPRGTGAQKPSLGPKQAHAIFSTSIQIRCTRYDVISWAPDKILFGVGRTNETNCLSFLITVSQPEKILSYHPWAPECAGRPRRASAAARPARRPRAPRRRGARCAGRPSPSERCVRPQERCGVATRACRPYRSKPGVAATVMVHVVESRLRHGVARLPRRPGAGAWRAPWGSGCTPTCARWAPPSGWSDAGGPATKRAG